MIREVNSAALRILGYERDELIGRPMSFIEGASDALKVIEQRRQNVLSGMGTVFEVRHRCKDGTIRDFESSVAEMQVGLKTFAISVERDITERTRGVDRIRRQLEHLTAMSAIDRVIASNYDLILSLSEILTHVTTELGMDAADILILNSNTQMLEFCAEHGFRTKPVRKAPIRLGESYAGRAALGRHLVQVSNLGDEPDNVLLTTHWKGEDFVCYYGVPLIAKGQVKGVLEVFHRTALEPDAEWFDFLNALAGQTAIAIENSTLFESLQRSNVELTLAYDATIEGWSHALDLRDKETEGHSKRVTEMTVKIARALGLSEADLVQVRWGALLHDIGKMGVPDGILLKPGPLTDEEWVAMKKHPTFAYEMLSPIRYLRLALDIPYCHHEKWNGTGYPRGLKGAQIPLTARIFAVVDVWDALRSERPYRAAWTKEKVHEHILALSGTDFDPRVVDVFMQNSD
jgi:PAS domain S-box-containing protein/putative nucleotidyltransferase with HDIG domain